ncbi:unnamed protein product [Cladocopium goreaui]|uniref:Uncharacterized protein n=1 Tax=Cladocopium goreaui TaxID=2562237 RepID=A0A9P1DRJ0_9DINO|nr:unnamed protein product [Cladocopium goreaui]
MNHYEYYKSPWEAAAKAFYKFIEAEFPPDPAVSYSTAADLQVEGTSLFLRPWQLPHRADYGLRGTSDGEVQHYLAQLVLLNGFQTDPNKPGNEKIVGCSVRTEWLYNKPTTIASSQIGEGSLANPGTLFLVKGWNRSLCCLGVLMACFQKPELLKDWGHTITVSFSTIYASAVQSDGNMIVTTNTGVTLGSQLRRRPNAFNLLHQLEFLERSGMTEDMTIKSLEAHQSVSAFAAAYQLGEKESAAAVNLLKHIPKDTKDALTELVRFEMRHGDADILQMMETTVPPADITKVAIFSQPLGKYNKEVEKESTVKAELAAQLLQTTYQQMELQCQSDLAKLREWAAKFDLYANKQASLDFKYINDRYQKGRTSIEEFMNSKHKFLRVSSLVLAHAAIVQAQGELGALSIDESVTLAQGVASGNAGTVSFWLLPQWHSSMGKQSVLKNRRLLEDKVIGSMDVYEIALNFQDSSHQGLAGVSSGQTNVAFSHSKSLLGTISGVERSRVQELQNPDPDKALAPHWRVQQRGIPATKEILLKLLDGMNERDGHKVLLVDMVPSRFSEWSQAAWDLQRGFLLGDESCKHWDCHFMSLHHDSDNFMDQAKDLITGRAMSQWWDQSQESGPAARSSEPFAVDLPQLECLTVADGSVKIPDLVMQKYATTHSDGLNAISESISQEAAMQKSVKMFSTPTSSAGTESRTLASPEWGPDAPVNWQKSVQLTGIALADFDSGNTPEGCGVLAREPQIQIVLTSLGSLWLVNRSGNDIVLPAGEIFGFNTGTFQEVPSDQCMVQSGTIAWHVTNDNTVVCLVSASGKKISTVADTMCDITRTRGVTEIRVTDHALQPKMQVTGDGSQIPLSYRYKVVPDHKVNAFKPKDLSSEDKLNLRAAQFGALYNGRFGQLPRSSYCTLVWEAGGAPKNIKNDFEIGWFDLH